MGKASSSKKIKRVQAAGATRSPGQRRQVGFPALIALIIVVGLVGTAFAVAHRRNIEEVRPTIDDDWVAAYGTYICGEDYNLGNLDTVVKDSPMDLHSDGLIHIHPTSEENAGDKAVFGYFLESAGITVADGTLTLPDGRTFTDGDDCDGEPGRVALYQWPPQAGENTDPRIISSNIATTRVSEDGQTYVLAFAPRGAEIPLPPSNANLDDPDNTEPKVVEPKESDGSGETTTTVSTVPGTETTVAGETTTTAAPGG